MKPLLWIFGALLVCTASCTQAPPQGGPRVTATGAPAGPGAATPMAGTTTPATVSPAGPATGVPVAGETARPGRDSSAVPPPDPARRAADRAASPPLDKCGANLKDIAAALRAYAADNGNHFPKTLEALQPKYLNQVPPCPVARSDTYSAGYAAASSLDAYTVVCAGSSHSAAGVPASFPQYSSRGGLLLKP